jgi:hypothetical protein
MSHHIYLTDFIQGGYGLRHFLHWCVQKVHDIKTLSDKTCTSLFNGRSLAIDEKLEGLLCYYSTQFEHLKFLLQSLCFHSAPTTQQGLRDLQSQLNAITMVKQVSSYFISATHCVCCKSLSRGLLIMVMHTRTSCCLGVHIICIISNIELTA